MVSSCRKNSRQALSQNVPEKPWQGAALNVAKEGEKPTTGKKVLPDPTTRAPVASSCCKSSRQLISQNGLARGCAQCGQVRQKKPWGPAPICPRGKNSFLIPDQSARGIFMLKKQHLIAARAPGRNLSKTAQKSPGKGDRKSVV